MRLVFKPLWHLPYIITKCKALPFDYVRIVVHQQNATLPVKEILTFLTLLPQMCILFVKIVPKIRYVISIHLFNRDSAPFISVDGVNSYCTE